MRSGRDGVTRPAGRGSEFLDGGNDAFGHQLERAERADPGQRALRHREAQLGQLVQALDGLLHPLTVLAEVVPDLYGLLYRGIVATLRGAVPAQHVELVRRLGGIEEVARVGVAGHQQQRLALTLPADEDRRVRAAQRLGRVQRAGQVVVLALERAVVIAPHLLADAQRLLQPFVALGQRGEEQAQPAGLILVPGRPDAQHRAPAGQHVQRRDRLRQQPGLAVDDRGHDREQLDAAGDGGQETQRGIGLQHLVLGRPERPDLPDVVHHTDAVYSRLPGTPGYLTQPRAQRGRPTVPGEIRDVQAYLHLRTPHRQRERSSGSSISGGYASPRTRPGPSDAAGGGASPGGQVPVRLGWPFPGRGGRWFHLDP